MKSIRHKLSILLNVFQNTDGIYNLRTSPYVLKKNKTYEYKMLTFCRAQHLYYNEMKFKS